MLGRSGTSSYDVFVYLCICIFVFACLTRGNIIFDSLEQSCFQKYTICWVLKALHMLYVCICVFVYLCLCIFVRHLVISVLISLDQALSENIWFVWSKSSFSGDKKGCGARGRRTTDDGRNVKIE